MKTRTVAFGSLAITITLLMLPVGALGDGDQKESSDYLNGFLGDVSFHTPECEPLLGQACFTVPDSAESVTITIEDASGLEVGFIIAGEGAGVCGSATRTVEPGEEIHVTTNGPVFGAIDCSSTTATTGTFTASFS